ncbi:MAG: type III pantothenate kinase [Armatimonadetes bacterium]|nr:type III pantothenate kinase [Armatimonadota bacterium]
MLLAIDVGNTNTAFAVFEGEKLVANWRVGTVARRTEDEYSVLLSGLFERDGIAFGQIDGIVISSVVPAVIFPLVKFAKRQLGIDDPLVLKAGEDAGIKIRYFPESDVGADRLANAVAAHALYPGPVIVVDFGTATTFDAVGADGTYLGGSIAPGIETSVEALVTKAAQLRRVQYVRPAAAVATTTVESLQSGVIFGFAGQVDGIVAKFREEIGSDARVIATGGLADLIASESKTIQEVNPLLTLQGLRLVYERRKSRRSGKGKAESQVSSAK